jgi:hypothetical protein
VLAWTAISQVAVPPYVGIRWIVPEPASVEGCSLGGGAAHDVSLGDLQKSPTLQRKIPDGRAGA